MTNIDRYRVGVVFITMTVFLAPIKAYAGTGGMGGLGPALAVLSALTLFVIFLIITAITIAVLKFRKKIQGWRRAKIILVVLLVPYCITGFAVNRWCFTRGLSNFGIRTISPYDAKDVALADSKTLLIEANTLIRSGNDRFWRHSDRRMLMRCDLTASLNNRKDVTESIKTRQFFEIPWDIKYGVIENTDGTSKIYSAQWVPCILERNSGTLSGIQVPLITDETLESAARQRQTFFYTAGDFKSHPMKKYLAIRSDHEETVIPIAFVYEGYESKLKEKTGYWMMRYLLYPVAVVADVATSPFQLYSFLDQRDCPGWTCGPKVDNRHVVSERHKCGFVTR